MPLLTAWLDSSVSHLGSQSIHAPHSCEQQAHHCHLDECFAGLHLPFVVFAHSSIAREPAECSLHHPSFGQDTEPTSTWCAFYHFEIPFSCSFAPFSGQFRDNKRLTLMFVL